MASRWAGNMLLSGHLAKDVLVWRRLGATVLKRRSFVAIDQSSAKENLDSKRYFLEKSSYTNFEMELFQTLGEGKDEFALSRFVLRLKKSGLLRSDPRLFKLFEKIECLKNKLDRNDLADVTIDAQQLKGLVKDNTLLIRKAFMNDLVIPIFPGFCKIIDDLYWKSLKNISGKVTSHSKVLSSQTIDKWGVSLCTVDGQRHNIGSSNIPVILHSCCNPINYALAIDEHGDAIEQYISDELKQNDSNETKLEIPCNPLTIPGALVVTSLLNAGLDSESKFKNLMERYSILSGGGRVNFNQAFHAHETGANDNIWAYGYHLRSNLCFPNGSDIRETLDLYFKLRSLEMSTESLSVLAATLANGGLCPITGERVMKKESVRSVITIMFSSGISSSFALDVGIPAMASISGGLMLVIPGLMGMFLWSPLLNPDNISSRGLQLCKKLSDVLDLHYFGNRTIRSDAEEGINFRNKDSEELLVWTSTKSRDSLTCMTRPDIEDRGLRTIQAIFSACLGDLPALRSLYIDGHNMNEADYDGRTPLHLAASQGKLTAARFLVEKCKVDVKVEDRWGSTPLDNARYFKEKEVENYLENVMSHCA